MSWKNIKTFLIILFVIINTYLIFSINGFDFKKSDTSYINKNALGDTIDIIKNNYNVILDEAIVPESFENIGIIDVTNIIYTDKFLNSPYNFKKENTKFEAEIKTETFSYNETNGQIQITKILEDIGIEKNSYTLDIKKSDEGLVCFVNEVLPPYPIFSGNIKAVFAPSKINIKGNWYITDIINQNTNIPSKMAEITSVIIDMAQKEASGDGERINIKSVEYGYYVSSYDENSVSKSLSAIPCYYFETDKGSKYYYDALNGKTLKQED